MPHTRPSSRPSWSAWCWRSRFGAVAHRLKASPLVGYLLAGVVIGPFTPGFVADQTHRQRTRRNRRHPADVRRRAAVLDQRAAVGPRHRDAGRARADRGRDRARCGACLAARLVARAPDSCSASRCRSPVPSSCCATCRSGACSTPSAATSRSAGWWSRTSRWCWCSCSCRRSPTSPRASRSRLSAIALPLAITLGKFAAFVVLMWLVGRRVIPWLLHYVAHTGSRELFRLAVLAIALGVAYGAATLFDVSFALGAFFAGMILSESTLSQRAAQETLPLRDAFAVLFFVSVGMLFNPAVILSHPLVAARDAADHHHRQVGGRLLRHAAVPLSGIDRADDRGEPRADRRVLVHPRGPRRRRSACCRARRARPHPCRRADLDPADAVPVRRAPTGSARITSRRKKAAAEPRAEPQPEPAETPTREPVPVDAG